MVSAGKHGVVIEDNGAKHKLFWDEVESVEKPGKHGETTAAWKPSEPGLVDPAKARAALEAAGWKVAAKGITTNCYKHPDHPGHGIGLSDEVQRWRAEVGEQRPRAGGKYGVVVEGSDGNHKLLGTKWSR